MQDQSIYLDFSDQEMPAALLSACARLYCRVWQEPPWEEYFWTVSQVKNDMLTQFQYPGHWVLVAIEKSAAKPARQIVAGFTWGYEIAIADWLAKLPETPELLALRRIDNHFFYVDELAVAKEYRQQGIGRALSSRLIAGSRCPLIILRTHDQATPAKGLYHSLGFRQIVTKDPAMPEKSFWCLIRKLKQNT